jgi:hypothetical protein
MSKRTRGAGGREDGRAGGRGGREEQAASARTLECIRADLREGVCPRAHSWNHVDVARVRTDAAIYP